MKYYYHLNNPFFQNPLLFGGVLVAQIGRMFCKSNTVINTHFHKDLFELTVVTGGKGTVFTNSVPTAVKKGDIYLSFPGDQHRIVSDQREPLKYDFFAFSFSDSPFSERFEEIRLSHGEETERLFSDERIQDLIALAIGEICTKSLFSNELLTAVFQEVMVYIVRDLNSAAEKRASTNADHGEILCFSLMNYIDTHLYTLENLKELEKVTDYSYSYLSAVFKKTTSQTLMQYYQGKKLSAAANLLKEKKHTVTQVAEMLNYSTPYAFSKAFKKQFGVSPKGYAKGDLL